MTVSVVDSSKTLAVTNEAVAARLRELADAIAVGALVHSVLVVVNSFGNPQSIYPFGHRMNNSEIVGHLAFAQAAIIRGK